MKLGFALGIEAFVEALPIFYWEATAESATLFGECPNTEIN